MQFWPFAVFAAFVNFYVDGRCQAFRSSPPECSSVVLTPRVFGAAVRSLDRPRLLSERARGGAAP
jgi:hypothetical protein